MAGRSASAFFFLVLVLAVGGVGWLLYTNGAPDPASPGPASVVLGRVNPPDGGEDGAAVPNPPQAGKPRKPKKPAPLPPEPPIPATPEACLAFLREQAGPFRAPKGAAAPLLPGARIEALDALLALSEAEAAPLVLQALGGDGEPGDWNLAEVRLHAAGIRIRQGQADGAETVKAYLKEEPDLGGNSGSAEAARAATRLPPEEGANIVRRLLAVDLSEYDADTTLPAILQAAATLGAGATPADLKRILDAKDENSFGEAAQGAAAGALLRLGDDSGRAAMDAVRESDWFSGDDFAAALGARGNASAIPWLAEMLGADDPFTRGAAARALGVVGGPEVTAPLRKAMADEDADVRAEAAVALALLGNSGDLPAVRAALHLRDDDLRVLAWKALALHPDPDAKEEAVRLLGTPSPNIRDSRREPAVRERVWAAVIVCKAR